MMSTTFVNPPRAAGHETRSGCLVAAWSRVQPPSNDQDAVRIQLEGVGQGRVEPESRAQLIPAQSLVRLAVAMPGSGEDVPGEVTHADRSHHRDYEVEVDSESICSESSAAAGLRSISLA
jgi:hypothetical protein